MATTTATATVGEHTVYERTFTAEESTSRAIAFIKARSAVTQAISMKYGLSEKGEEIIHEKLNEDIKLRELAMGLRDTWSSPSSKASITIKTI